jgi:hypothetical protein
VQATDGSTLRAVKGNERKQDRKFSGIIRERESHEEVRKNLCLGGVTGGGGGEKLIFVAFHSSLFSPFVKKLERN